MSNTNVSSILILLIIVLMNASLVSGWSNGGYSDDPANPDYGTHDWIAQHALDNLSTNEKQYLLDNLDVFLYSTELPDKNQAPDGIGDTGKHHFYFYTNGTVKDDAAAIRAAQSYQTALNYLKEEDYENASKFAGIMRHYIKDVVVWAHVMGTTTEWGSKTGNKHPNYESYIDRRTEAYIDEFNMCLSYDGSLIEISAYNATKQLVYNTTFDENQQRNCTWMNQNYDVNNPIYWERAGESLNLAVNYLADVLHTLLPRSSPRTNTNPNIATTGNRDLRNNSFCHFRIRRHRNISNQKKAIILKNVIAYHRLNKVSLRQEDRQDMSTLIKKTCLKFKEK